MTSLGFIHAICQQKALFFVTKTSSNMKPQDSGIGLAVKPKKRDFDNREKEMCVRQMN